MYRSHGFQYIQMYKVRKIKWGEDGMRGMRKRKDRDNNDYQNHFVGRVKMSLNLFDLHCHLLYGVDDGAVSLEDSLRAVRIASEEGIGYIVFTPHYTPGKLSEEKEVILRRMKEIREAAENAGIEGIKYYIGNEVLYTSGVEELLKQGEIFTIADTKYVLLEFYQGVRYQDMFQGLSRVVRMGVIPVLAHVERYNCLYQRLERIEELRDLGIVIQMNTECLIQRIPNVRLLWYRKLMMAGYVQLISTDAHGADKKPPRMKKAVEWMEQHCDCRLVERVLYENPARVLDGQIL